VVEDGGCESLTISSLPGCAHHLPALTRSCGAAGTATNHPTLVPTCDQSSPHKYLLGRESFCFTPHQPLILTNFYLQPVSTTVSAHWTCVRIAGARRETGAAQTTRRRSTNTRGGARCLTSRRQRSIRILEEYATRIVKDHSCSAVSILQHSSKPVIIDCSISACVNGLCPTSPDACPNCKCQPNTDTCCTSDKAEADKFNQLLAVANGSWLQRGGQMPDADSLCDKGSKYILSVGRKQPYLPGF
jgi:hypothetical protein